MILCAPTHWSRTLPRRRRQPTEPVYSFYASMLAVPESFTPDEAGEVYSTH